MRIRSIRPEFWSSEDIAAMDWHTRLVYIGLWSYVDDNGVGRDLDRLITTSLFPLDRDLPEASRRVTGALKYLSDHGHITRYEVDGKRYLHVSKWTKHQRIEKASKGRYPQPDAENATFPDDSGSTPGTLSEISTPGEGEKGRRGEGEKPSPSEAAAPDPKNDRDDITELCEYLSEHLEALSIKHYINSSWRDAARLMLDRDGRTVAQVKSIIDFALGDDFWKGNVHSMPTVRKQFDKLRIQMQQPRPGNVTPFGRPKRDVGVDQWLA